jgi:hypothetical protein
MKMRKERNKKREKKSSKKEILRGREGEGDLRKRKKSVIDKERKRSTREV